MSDNLQNNRFSFNPKEVVIGAQMLFVAFGALVLVPLLTGWGGLLWGIGEEEDILRYFSLSPPPPPSTAPSSPPSPPGSSGCPRP